MLHAVLFLEDEEGDGDGAGDSGGLEGSGRSHVYQHVVGVLAIDLFLEGLGGDLRKLGGLDGDFDVGQSFERGCNSNLRVSASVSAPADRGNEQDE